MPSPRRIWREMVGWEASICGADDDGEEGSPLAGVAVVVVVAELAARC